ncbi:MAG: AIPR family protein [Odoribacter splanchnicus]
MLEQNVRSFLQFTGKINKGIRKTILEEPEMFLAFNNGLAVTAGELLLEPSERGEPVISEITDLQIVNGGQTTASLYHTLKKDKADLSRVFVQAKISVINNREHFADIVARISECANTQNKVSISDLSSNNPGISSLKTFPVTGGVVRQGKQKTCWFYESPRTGKNARQREGFTSRAKMFDLKYPVNNVYKRRGG